jgi:cytochrome c553
MGFQRFSSSFINIRRHTAWVALLAGLMLPALAAASPDVVDIGAGEKIYTSFYMADVGGKKIPACQKCHGADAMGNDDIGTPRLASQVYAYLYKQMVDFATDRRTDDVMHKMNAIAKALTDQQRKDVAAYLHTLQAPYTGSNMDKLREEGVHIGDAARGQMIVTEGIPEENVPACQSCHGYRGHSAGMLFPAISGQNYVYLRHELKSFRHAALGKPGYGRANDYMGLMRAVAGKLSDRDIDDVAAYLTGANPPPPPNNPLDPGNG